VDQNLSKLSEKPLLICWGEHDFVFDKDYLKEWQKRFPNAEIYSFPDAGHYALEDIPDTILGKVKQFLEKYPV
jgi:haloalkane dehalogenase